MDIRRYCQVMGAVFIAIGILGFLPGAIHRAPAMDSSTTGFLFGLFPVNPLHNLIHVVFGIWAFSSSRWIEKSRLFCATTAIFFGVLTAFGFIPGLNNIFGLVPLYSHNVWLHGIIALSSAYFAWSWTERPTLGTHGHSH